MANFATGDSHAKIILFGEHSAVYGKDAITLPILKLKVNVIISENFIYNEIKSNIYEGPLIDAPIEFQGIKKLISHMFEINKIRSKFISINFNNKIPIGRGLGSSAAVACSLIRAFYQYFNIRLTKSMLISLINISEKIIHGSPSGIDAQTVTSQSPISFENNHIENLSLKLKGDIIITDTGMIGNTKDAISMVKKVIEASSNNYLLIDQLGEIVKYAKKAINNGDILEIGNLMNQSQQILTKFGISTNQINEIISTANSNGALGSKLTGSGLGGCVISLSQDENTTNKIIKSLQNNGYNQNWVQPLSDFETE